MRKVYGVLMALLLIFSVGGSLCPNANASTANFFEQGNVNSVGLWLIDDSDNSNPGVSLYIANLLPTGYHLQYNIPSSGDTWQTCVSFLRFFTIITDIDLTGKELMYLRIADSTGAVDGSANLTFLDYEKTVDGLDWYTGLMADWGETSGMQLTFAFAGNGDNIAPVPIPGAVWLIGSGVFGLLVLRKKMKE